MGILAGGALGAMGLPARADAPLPPEQALFSPLPPRDPWIAAGLSFAVNGTGQFYNQQSDKGWLMLAPVLAYPAAWLIDYALGTGYARGACGLAILGTKTWSVWDAYQSAPTAPRTP